MRYSASEKLEIINLVEQSSLSVRRTLVQLGIPKSTFYLWYDRYSQGGVEALEDRKPEPKAVWNKIPDETNQAVLDLALEKPELSPREIAVTFTDTRQTFVSEASVYRLLKAHDLITSPAYILMKAADCFANPTTAPNQLWQTDFTYLKVIGWGWFYLSTVLDDFSRYILAWKLCTTMAATDVTDTLEIALEAAGLDTIKVRHRPRLLSDNGPSYVAGELADWLQDNGMTHTRGRPYHPMTQGKIERWHRSMKNIILLENYYLPGELEARIGQFVAHYNDCRYHESLANLTPADVYLGRGQRILERRQLIKRRTLEDRRQRHLQSAA
jgi:putative transposase